MSVQNIPAEVLPFKYMYGMQISNNATTPNTKVDVAAGQCRDYNDVLDIVLDAAITIDATVTGYNGLDTGSLAASSFYAVYVIADSSNYNPVGGILTLQTSSAPVMPFGYDSYRLIGFMLTDVSSHFLAFYMATAASGNNRWVQYDAPIAVTVSASGTSTNYSAMDLSVAVPASHFEKVKVYAKWDPNAAADTLTLQATGGSGNWLINTAVGGAVQDFSFDILPLLSSGAPKISYKVSTSSATLTAVTVLGYNMIV